MLLQLTIFDIELKNNIEINFEKFFGSFDYYKNRWRNSKFPEQTRTSGLQNNISVSFKRKATDFRETAKVLHCDKYTHFDAKVFIRRSYKLVLIFVTILIVLGRVLMHQLHQERIQIHLCRVFRLRIDSFNGYILISSIKFNCPSFC